MDVYVCGGDSAMRVMCVFVCDVYVEFRVRPTLIILAKR